MIGNCDCCPRRDVPGSVVDCPGEPFACYICQGNDFDPYCEIEDEIEKLRPIAETGEQWAHIAALEAAYVDATGKQLPRRQS